MPIPKPLAQFRDERDMQDVAYLRTSGRGRATSSTSVNFIRVPAVEVDVNGGSQFRRFMLETETFLRVSRSALRPKWDVLQSLGVPLIQSRGEK